MAKREESLTAIVRKLLGEAESREGKELHEWLEKKVKETGLFNDITPRKVITTLHNVRYMDSHKAGKGPSSPKPSRKKRQPKETAPKKPRQLKKREKSSSTISVQAAQKSLDEAEEKAKEAGNALAEVVKASRLRDAARKDQISSAKEAALGIIDGVQEGLDAVRREIDGVQERLDAGRREIEEHFRDS